MSLRDAMPITAAWIDELREAFGREGIDAEIRKGMNGVPGFWARENGREVGTRFPPAVAEVSGAEMVIRPEVKS
jgi:hypothetical protein